MAVVKLRARRSGGSGRAAPVFVAGAVAGAAIAVPIVGAAAQRPAPTPVVAAARASGPGLAGCERMMHTEQMRRMHQRVMMSRAQRMDDGAAMMGGR